MYVGDSPNWDYTGLLSVIFGGIPMKHLIERFDLLTGLKQGDSLT